ncbi:MAG: hypothetical protein AAF845_10900 [Bacteroidota bacterium]
MPDVRAWAGRHRRIVGLAGAAVLLVAYIGAVRPARLWTAEHVAYPLLRAVDTPRAEALDIARVPRRPDAVWAIPSRLGVGPEAAIQNHRDEVAEWAAPIGVIFLLPAMFLVAAYPTRPYWLWLLAYHVVLGLVSLAVFALGVGWFEPAFAVYTFSRTYLAEAVSLVVPLLLVLAGGEVGRLGESGAARPRKRSG